MNVTEIEQLLYRMDATYHGAVYLSDVERKIRVEEWADSSLADIDWVEVGRPAWVFWKANRDRPPTLSQYLEACRARLRDLQLARPRLVEPEPSDEERARVRAVVVEAHDLMAQVRRDARQEAVE